MIFYVTDVAVYRIHLDVNCSSHLLEGLARLRGCGAGGPRVPVSSRQ